MLETKNTSAVIEMHSDFLETNFLSQIRALPNPMHRAPAGTSASHPITLHLSATSSANVIVTSLVPAPPASSAFAKISGENAEVIVAPKSRPKAGVPDEEEKGMNGSAHKTPLNGARPKSARSDNAARAAVFLRGVDRAVAQDWFLDEVEADEDAGLKVWVDPSVIGSKDLKGFAHVWVSVVHPPSHHEDEPEQMKGATKIVALLVPWEDAPDPAHAALSSDLSGMLGVTNVAGSAIRLEPAPPQVSKSAVRSLRIYPFTPTGDKQKEDLRFGNRTKSDAVESAKRILSAYITEGRQTGVLNGPITDGMCLSSFDDADVDSGLVWHGGIVKFHPAPGPFLDQAKTTRGWLLGSDRRLVVGTAGESPKVATNDRKLLVEVMSETARLSPKDSTSQVGTPLPRDVPQLVGVSGQFDRIISALQHASSVLVTGSHGAGKTSLAQSLAHSIRRQHLAFVVFYPCRLLVNDEMRTANVKETLDKIFGLATWGSRLGGRALVVLDDLDLLCPAESELEVGNDNSRNRQISEMLVSCIRRHCTLYSRVVLLATAQSKEAIHNNVIAGHVAQDIVHLPAPDKDTRRAVLESFVRDGAAPNGDVNKSRDIDFLDVAGRTDGFMPGDLLLLKFRAQSEALIRSISDATQPQGTSLTQADFESALRGFTPTSLRNVTLQHSSTTFSSIGGLAATRKILMETLQYPTLYSPIFARCPLRLRSGLLLYGYPGCGKTLLASAVAGECGLNFISVKGPEILNKYIGASEKSVRDLFERAQAARPCVLFFDEFDSVAPKRGHDSTGVTDRVVNQLLTQMDGAEGLSGVYVLAATSRPDLIDPALLRPGRLDKSLICNMPDQEDRKDILLALSKKLKVAEDVGPRLQTLAQRTEGYTGADLQAVVYNAHLEAIHDVLDDALGTDSKKKASGGASNDTSGPPLDFSHFRMGDSKATSNSENASEAARQASEKARIMQSLLAHRSTQQRIRKMRRETAAATRSGEEMDTEQHESKTSEKEPQIRWAHFERALAQTRPSISGEEVRRLGRIYDEFVASRNGEMPSGQGGNEIGGRSSLM